MRSACFGTTDLVPPNSITRSWKLSASPGPKLCLTSEHRLPAVMLHKPCSWHNWRKLHQNITTYSSRPHSAWPLNYIFGWNWPNKKGSLQGCWPGKLHLHCRQQAVQDTLSVALLLGVTSHPKKKQKHCRSPSLVPLISTLSTPSNHCDIWVPLCVSFLRSNHLNPPLKQSRPCWGTHNRCLSHTPQPWPRWHLQQSIHMCTSTGWSVGSTPCRIRAWIFVPAKQKSLTKFPIFLTNLFFFFFFPLKHISPAQPLSTFVCPFEEIKEKHQLWRAMSAGWPHSQRASSHCLLFNPRLVLLFNFSFGRYPVFFFSPGGGSRMVSSVLIEAKSMITFGHLQWKGISAALAGTRCIMDQCKIPPFDCYSIIH